MKLGQVIVAYRTINHLNVRTLAREIGISYPTLSRIERGNGCDSATLTKILTWLLAEG